MKAPRLAVPRVTAPLSRDKQDTLLLIASTVLVLLPHVAHLPVWITLLCGATLVWRAALTLLGRRMPRNVLLVPVAGLAMLGVLQSYHTLLGRDAGVAMLVLLVAFKMLEMHARRDLFVVIFLCFFLALTNFFYSQGIGTAVLMLVSLAALLTTQLSFQFTGAVPPLRARLWMGARMLLWSLPLALGAFVLFPRIDGPLWGMRDEAHGATVGLSDTMSPGQMSDLAKSDDVAFHVSFDGPAPAQRQLYWRGPVLGSYDGRTWTRMRDAASRRPPQPVSISVNGAPVRYAVTMEATHARWLFALEVPQALPALPGHLVRLSGELEIQADTPVNERTRYDMASFTNFTLQAGDRLANAEQWLLLPIGGDADRNPRALAEGQLLRAEPDPVKRVATVLHRLRTGGYSYTLQPPLLGENAVDEFLYDTRAGFCEHFAGAFVFLMRAAGVPARVVLGYQGGETNPIDGVLTVRQSDAHAWAEVWLPDRGWMRIDPTAMAAPQRVERSTQQVPPAGLSTLGRLLRPDPDSLLARVRFAIGAVNDGWRQWVLNYSPRRQHDLLDSLQAGLLRWQNLALVALVVPLLLLGAKFDRRRRRDPVDTLYSALCERLGQLGLPRAPDEGPNAYACRLGDAALADDARAAAAEFLRRYSVHRYAAPGAVASAAALVPTLKTLLSRVR